MSTFDLDARRTLRPRMKAVEFSVSAMNLLSD